MGQRLALLVPTKRLGEVAIVTSLRRDRLPFCLQTRRRSPIELKPVSDQATVRAIDDAKNLACFSKTLKADLDPHRGLRENSPAFGDEPKRLSFVGILHAIVRNSAQSPGRLADHLGHLGSITKVTG